MTEDNLLKPSADLGSLSGFQEYVRGLESDRGFTGDSVMQKCLLLGEEVGELFRSLRKSSGVGIDLSSQRDANPAHELADILIVLATIANRLDVDLEEALRSKEAINAGRTWE